MHNIFALSLDIGAVPEIFKLVYMDASKLPGIFGCAVRQVRLQFYIRPFCRSNLLAPMESADPSLICRAGC
jgi:hypothetical protein